MNLEKAVAASDDTYEMAPGNRLNTKDAMSREPVPEGVMPRGMYCAAFCCGVGRMLSFWVFSLSCVQTHSSMPVLLVRMLTTDPCSMH